MEFQCWMKKNTNCPSICATADSKFWMDFFFKLNKEMILIVDLLIVGVRVIVVFFSSLKYVEIFLFLFVVYIIHLQSKANSSKCAVTKMITKKITIYFVFSPKLRTKSCATLLRKMNEFFFLLLIWSLWESERIYWDRTQIEISLCDSENYSKVLLFKSVFHLSGLLRPSTTSTKTQTFHNRQRCLTRRQ